MIDKLVRSTKQLCMPEHRHHRHILQFHYIEDSKNTSTITVALNSKATFLDIDIFSATVDVDPIQPTTATHDSTVNGVAF
jgi:hypothetical protein